MLRASTAATLLVRRQFATRQALLLRDFALKGRTEPSGSVVTVSAGYLRNYMFPRQIAVPAVAANLEKYAHLIDELNNADGDATAVELVEDVPSPRAQTVSPSARTPMTNASSAR